MISLIPEAARAILDVGCGAGLLLEDARRRRTAPVVLHGVEPDGFAALAAASRLDKVFEGTAEAVADSLPDGFYDAIVLSDVLEHAVSPDVLLRSLAPTGARKKGDFRVDVSA